MLRPDPLFTFGTRGNSVAPEILEFFNMTDGEPPAARFQIFCQLFGGMRFNVPKRDFLRELDRDRTIVRALRHDESWARRRDLMTRYKLKHGYLESLFEHATGKRLPPVAEAFLPDRMKRLEFALKTCNRVPRADIFWAFGISAGERAGITRRLGTARKRKNKSKS